MNSDWSRTTCDRVAGRRPADALRRAARHFVDDLTVFVPDCWRTSQHDGRLAVHVRRTSSASAIAVLDARDVAEQDGVAFLLPNDDVAERLHRLHAAAGAQRHAGGALLDAAAGDLDVLRLQRTLHVGDGEVVGAQPVGVELDVDLARAAADDHDLADAADALELPAQRSCRRTRVMSRTGLSGRDRQRQDRAPHRDRTSRPSAVDAAAAAAAARGSRGRALPARRRRRPSRAGTRR